MILPALNASFGISWAIVLFLVIFACWTVAKYFRNEHTIRRLGGHAPRFLSKIPLDNWLGCYFIWDMINHGLRDEYLKFVHNCFARIGDGRENRYTFEVALGGVRTVWTADSENIKAMMATQFTDFGRGEAFRKRWYDVLGTSIFNSDGREWHESRQRLRPLFTRQRISNLDCFERHVQHLMEFFEGGQTVDMKDLIGRFSLDAAADYALGCNVGALDDRENDFMDALEQVKKIMSIMECAGPVSPLIPRIGFRRHVQRLDDFVMPIINKAVSLPQSTLDIMEKTDVDWTFLHACASVCREPQFLKYELMSVLLAGRDTISSTLTWTMIELGRNPQLLDELRLELQETTGLGASARRPSFADLRAMKLMINTLNETLRLYPTVSLNYRCALRDTSLPRGGGSDGTASIGVRAGTPVLFSSHILHLSPETYGDSSPDCSPPHIFDPHRWDSWVPQPWTYIPFGGGPRVCLGHQLAMTEMAYVLARILQRFSRLEMRAELPGNSPDGWERRNGSPGITELFMNSNARISGEITLSPRGAVMMACLE